MITFLVPVPIPLPQQLMAPNDFGTFIVETMPVLFVILLIPILIRIAFEVIRFVNAFVHALPPEPTEKRKHEPVGYFDADTEPDYVVGFGDDGELLYASDKPKRKNDEVVE